MGKEILGKIQPQSIDTEEVILGAMMLERNAVIDVIDIIKPESFYDTRNSLIFIAIKDLFNTSQPVDILTVKSELKKSGNLEKAGGAYHIADLTTKVNSAANIETHARILAELSMKRELIRISSQTLSESYEETNDVFTIVAEVDAKINSLVEENTKGVVIDFKRSLFKSIQTLQDAVHQDLTGVPSGFVGLDRITGGWQNSDLVILAARPGMGKTALVVSFMLNAAIMFKKSVAMFSLEMSIDQLMKRVISSECKIPLEKIKNPKSIETHEWELISHKTAEIENAPIFIDDTPAMSIIELRAKTNRLKRKHGIDMIIVDYLQLMRGDGKGNREQEIGSISRGLKLIAKELDVPVIALSQLSRAVESRGGDKRPMLSDLRESGSIEQDADMVGFIYRPEYYDVMEASDGTSLEGKGQIIIAKNRQGAVDDVYLNFLGEYTKWTDDEVFKDTSIMIEPPKTETFPTNGNAEDFDTKTGDIFELMDDHEKKESPF